LIAFLVDEAGVDLVNNKDVEGPVTPCAPLFVVVEEHISLKFMGGPVNNLVPPVALFCPSLLVLKVVGNLETHQVVKLFLFLHIP